MATFNIDVTVENSAKLYAAAARRFAEINNVDTDDQDLIDFIGTPGEPKLDKCLIQLFDDDHGDAGISVQDSYAELTADDDGWMEPGKPTVPSLRNIPTATASTAHITPDELNRINAAFAWEGDPNDQRAKADIEHDGLYMSPKAYGFYVRMPTPEMWTDVSSKLSPQMLSILSIARDQGAIRVEFDADEDAIELPTFEH